jgi:hypothetical protein
MSINVTEVKYSVWSSRILGDMQFQQEFCYCMLIEDGADLSQIYEEMSRHLALFVSDNEEDRMPKNKNVKRFCL